MICLVRHAQTDFNKDGIIQSRLNEHINDKGIRETQKLREKISSIKFDICYTSSLIRTIETAMLLIGDKTLIVQDDRLIEREMGEFEGVARNLYDSKKYWDYNLNCSECGVESVRDLFSRCRDFLEDIERMHPNKNILIVSHAAVIRALHFLLSGSDLSSEVLELEVLNLFFEKFE